jgi:drug/metabolite transporter (DMT)-like permease
MSALLERHRRRDTPSHLPYAVRETNHRDDRRMKPWNSAWLLLGLANLFWAGNIVLGRGVAGMVPPIALAYCRWTGAFLIALTFAWPQLRRDLPTLLRHWRIMLVLSAVGIASYNTMCYIGLNSTTALNVLLLQSAMPLVIIVWSFALFGDRPTTRQALGVLLSLIGVLEIAARGSADVLLNLRFNPGDIWVLAAIVVSGPYYSLLRRRPPVHHLSFLVAAMGIGSCMMLPFVLAEYATGARIEGGAPAFLAMAYIAVFPSLIAYLFFNRSVELIGANLAGQSMHLMPLFGSILAVLFLGETFHIYHAVGIALIATGILLATLKSAPVPQPVLNAAEAERAYDRLT